MAGYDIEKKCWVFAVYKGATYGLLSAVMNFNRLPCLVTAFTRRCTGVLVGAYFDDNLIVDIEAAAGEGQRIVQQKYSAVGAPMSEKKRIPMGLHLSLIHISEPTNQRGSRMPSSA